MKNLLIKPSFIVIILVVGAIIITSMWFASNSTTIDAAHDLRYDPPTRFTMQTDSTIQAGQPASLVMQDNHVEESDQSQQQNTIKEPLPLLPQSESINQATQAQSVNEDDDESQSIASDQIPQRSAGPNYVQLNRQIIDITNALERFNSKLIIKSSSSENSQ